MSQARECEHGLPYGICMKDECVQKFMSGRLQRFDRGLAEESPRDWNESDADMDTIIAHECQHGSDMRVCEKCTLIDMAVRNEEPTGRTVAEWLSTIEADLDN